MREKNITLYERNVMRIIGGLLFDMAPNRQPRNAEIIMTKVRDTFREKAYNSNEFYMLVLKDDKDTIYTFIKDMLMNIPEFKDLNLSYNEYNKNISIDDPSRETYKFISMYDKNIEDSWKDDFIDLDAFINNVVYLIMDNIKSKDCFGCKYYPSDRNHEFCNTCILKYSDLKNNFESERKPRGKYTFACKYNCYKSRYICCEECKDKDTCTQKCESSSTNCNLAINRINEKKN